MGFDVQTTEKQGCKIVTCEPATRRIEAAIKSGAILQVAVYTVTPLFRWPMVGENWMIRRENGTWYLDSLWQNPEEDALIEHLEPGGVLIDSPNGKVQLTDGTFLGGLETGDIKLSARSSCGPLWLGPCTHQEVSRATYAALFAEVGTTFGEGDKSTTFNLPPATGAPAGMHYFIHV